MRQRTALRGRPKLTFRVGNPNFVAFTGLAGRCVETGVLTETSYKDMYD